MLAVNVLEGIITKPVVQSSRESNVPAWLTLPIVGSVTVGLTFLYGQSSVLSVQSNIKWVGVLYMVSGALFFLAAILGWSISVFSILNSRDKRNKSIGVLLFIGIKATNALLIGKLHVEYAHTLHIRSLMNTKPLSSLGVYSSPRLLSMYHSAIWNVGGLLVLSMDRRVAATAPKACPSMLMHGNVRNGKKGKLLEFCRLN